MEDDKRLSELQRYIGRLCIYIEDGVFSVACVAAVAATAEGMQAVMVAVPEHPLVCHYREEPPRFADEPHPVGARWEISRRWEWCYPDEEVWDGSLYMGFRVLFASDVVQRFLARDLTWLDEYF